MKPSFYGRKLKPRAVEKLAQGLKLKSERREVQNRFWIYNRFWILVPRRVDVAHCSQTSELLDPGHAPSPEHARRPCSPVPTSFSSFVFIFLIFIFPVSALTASLQFLCIQGAQPGWMECVLGKYLFNEWLIDVYLFSLHEADGLVAFTVWWRFQATSGFDNLSSVPRKPLDEQHLPSCLGLDFFIFATWHVPPLPPPEQTNFFSPLKENLEDPLSKGLDHFVFLFVFRMDSIHTLRNDLSKSCLLISHDPGSSPCLLAWMMGRVHGPENDWLASQICHVTFFPDLRHPWQQQGYCSHEGIKENSFTASSQSKRAKLPKEMAHWRPHLREGLSDFQCREEKSRQVYNKPPTYQQVLFQEWVHKSNLFESPTKLAQVPN